MLDFQLSIVGILDHQRQDLGLRLGYKCNKTVLFQRHAAGKGILHGIAGRARENMEEDVLSMKA